VEVRHDEVGVVVLEVAGTIASIRPEKPPIVNRNRNASANSIGVSKVIEPFHMVATQLNTFTPVGTAISIVAYMKNSSPASGMPTVNMWCAQTMNDRKAIEAWRRPSPGSRTAACARRSG
jgi:hypothetical protein